jgi:hypothetical protein
MNGESSGIPSDPDQATEEASRRIEEAGGFSGDSFIRISLMWDNCNDLDLWLEEPGQVKIYYGRKTNTETGASLDVDANGSGCRTQTPVENIVYSNEAGVEHPPPLTGEYKVTVHYYRQHFETTPSTYTLLIRLRDKTFAFSDVEISTGAQEYYFNYNEDAGCASQEAGCAPVPL